METYEDQKLKNLPALKKLVLDENVRQLNIWGARSHTLFAWYTILAEEFGELGTAMLNRVYGGVRGKEIRQEAIAVATLALKIAEMVNEE